MKNNILNSAIIVITIYLTFCLTMKTFSVNKVRFIKEEILIDSIINPLGIFSKEWIAEKYSACNTAKEVNYYSTSEKEIIQILNMIRMNPELFLNSVLLNPSSPYYKIQANRNQYDLSLIETLKKIRPNYRLLIPDKNAYISAKCHAEYSGKTGYVGHERINSNCTKDFYGECCSYGYSDALSILMALLLDYNVPSLGHREICLSTDFSSIGVSIQSHKIYDFNAVLDFK